MVFMSATFLFSIPLMLKFYSSWGGMQLTTGFENIPWIPAIGARYHVAIDGISLWLVMLTTFLGPILVLSSYTYIKKRTKEYHIALLVLQTAMLGALVSMDVFLFYIFWELMLIPMYFLIGIWGGDQKVYAAVKLFIYTMVGSVLMLVGLLYIYAKGGMNSFALDDMIQAAQMLSAVEQKTLFAVLALAFLIKVPLFPFHTWLPDAHVQAPTAGSVVLASVLLKMGTYGMIRFAMPMLPDGIFWAAPFIAVLSVIGIVYTAIIAYVQKDVKKLIAYSSVSHLGFVTLGLVSLSPVAVSGAILQSLAHGISTGGLFLGIGILYERRHTRKLSEFGGIAKQMPKFATLFVIIAMTSAGVPGLAGFAGEFMILTGTSTSYALSFGDMWHFRGVPFGPEYTAVVFASIAATGLVLGALYLLWMLQKTLFGPLENPKNKNLKDISFREGAYLAPIVFMCFFMGIKPQFFLEKINASVEIFVENIEQNAVEFQELVQTEKDLRRSYSAWMDDMKAEEPWSIQNSYAEEEHADHETHENETHENNDQEHEQHAPAHEEH